MKLTSQMIKERAAELGIDCIAIGNIERFAGAPKLMAPQSIFPEARSVIAVAMRIPRGTYRGIEEGTHWHNYTFYSYNKLNTLFRPHLSYELCCFIEDHGYEAVPHFPAVPEGNGTTREPVAEGKLPPDVVCSVRVIAAGCGIGEIGYSKVFLTKKFGPRVRLGLIFTDAELEPDPILDTGDICLHCGACVRECPGNAVPPVKNKDERLYVDFNGEKQIWYADVRMGRCTLSHHGLNNECSPFLKKEFPNMALEVRNTEMTEEEAYIMTYTMADGKWGRKPGAQVMNYYDYIKKHTGYYAICGARGCIRACMNALEKTKRIENLFHNPFYYKKSWLLPHEPTEVPEGVNPYREAYLDEKYPGIRDGEYVKAKK
ncbi:MAG: hypothetical protein IJY16_07130 [Clostridia bacterium]|nr:hypothetical protein [Clostridia bacterium]